jgi:hypothetical protein
MTLKISARMKDAHDVNNTVSQDVEHDVRGDIVSAIAGADIVASAAKRRLLPSICSAAMMPR